MAQRSDAKESNVTDFDGSLAGYAAYAVDKSPKLRASFERWRSEVASVSKHRRLPEPVVTYSYYVLGVETRLGPQRHKLGLKQSFPWPTTLTAGSDAASAMARAAERRYDAEALELRWRIAIAYYELWKNREIVAVQNRVLDVARGSSEAVRAGLVLGRSGLSDQQQVDLFVARLEDAIDTRQGLDPALSARLISEIGAPPGNPAPTTQRGIVCELPALTHETLRSAMRGHPEVEAFEFEAQGADSMARQARAEGLPGFTLGLDWIATGETDLPDIPDSGRDALIIGVGLSLPLWRRGYANDVRAHEATAQAFRAEKQHATRMIDADIQIALARIRNSKRTVDLHRTTLIPQAQSALDSVIGAYTTNRSTVGAILLAEQTLLELQLELVEAFGEHKIAWAELERRVGQDVPRGGASR